MRRRRISVRVEHRQETVALAQGSTSPAGMEVMAAAATNCPSCGTPWLTSLQEALADGQIGTDLLQAAVQDRRLHLRQQPDGQLWVCEQSLRQLSLGQTGETA